MAEYAMPYHAAPPQPAPPAPRSASPVISLAASLVALLGVLALTGFLASSGAFASGGDAPLTGQVEATAGGALRGDALARDLTRLIEDDGGDVSDLRCPDTATVRQGAATICHGTISGSAWAVAVFFEDSQGRFTALPM